MFEPEWSVEYAHRLEEHAKKQLMIWPYHTLLGTPGHTITPALYEAFAFHAAARRSQPRFVIKGTIAKTEFYSLLEPEVPVPEDPAGRLNEAFLNELLGYDSIYIAGQAKSHCVLETVASIVRRFGHQPEVMGKLHILTDCTSSVAHPEIDFDAMAHETFERFAGLGVKLVASADPIE
jgi:nicotinamidase-related amidase